MPNVEVASGESSQRVSGRVQVKKLRKKSKKEEVLTRQPAERWRAVGAYAATRDVLTMGHVNMRELGVEAPEEETQRKCRGQGTGESGVGDGLLSRDVID